jgi:hypothetical protein
MSIKLETPFIEFVWNLFHYRTPNVNYEITEFKYDNQKDSKDNLIIERKIQIDINKFLPFFIRSLFTFNIFVFSEIIIINFNRELLNIKINTEHKDYFNLKELTIVKKGTINYTSNVESSYGSLLNNCALNIYNQQRMKSLNAISKQIETEDQKYTEEDILNYLKS